MHIEPGLVDAAKITLSYGTAAAAATASAKVALDHIRAEGAASLAVRSMIATALVFVFFEVLPHVAVGVSEVHLIMGTTLLLLLGTAPAAVGLAAGLAIQGLFFAPADLPQYALNVTTLLAPLFAIHLLARRVVPSTTTYVDLGYAQVLKLSVAYQGGIVAWVAFWAIYGQGFGAQNLASVGSFGLAYMTVVLLEPLVDLGALAIAKALRDRPVMGLFSRRLFAAA